MRKMMQSCQRRFPFINNLIRGRGRPDISLKYYNKRNLKETGVGEGGEESVSPLSYTTTQKSNDIWHITRNATNLMSSGCAIGLASLEG